MIFAQWSPQALASTKFKGKMKRNVALVTTLHTWRNLGDPKEDDPWENRQTPCNIQS
jgi:hypothetical protein